MIGISRGMVAAAAVIAFGFVTVEDMAKGLATPASAQIQDTASDSAVVQHGVLRERAAAALGALADRQTATRVAAEPVERPKCRDQSWPYSSNDCLVRVDAAEPLPVIRVVQIDRRADRPVFIAKLP